MFTLGEKFRVLNTSADLEVYDTAVSTSLQRATVADIKLATKATTYFKIKGFGKFALSDITEFYGIRAKAATAEVSTNLVVVPTGLAPGNVIEARITLATERYEGELANNYITGGRPIVIQTAPLTTIGANDIAIAVAAAWNAYVGLFNKATFAISTITAPGAGVITVTMASGYEGVTLSKIEISISAQGSGTYPKTKLVKTVTTAGSQGRGLGKFLEESIRVGTADNVRTYGMNASSDTSVDVRGSYTQFNWRMTANYDHALGNDSVDFKPTAEHSFTLFLNEATCMTAANDTTSALAINRMSELVLKAALLTPVTTNVSANDATSTAAYALVPLLRPTDIGALTTITFTT
jgi:hypothetical protein